MKYLPEPLQESLLRQLIRVPLESPPELVIKLAETEDELTEAFRVLHDSYVQSNFSSAQSSGLRLIKQFSAPTTCIIVAKWNHQVVGTLSVVVDGPMGLPMESEFDLSVLRSRSLRFGEISSLAIKKEFRHNKDILLLMFNFYLWMARDYLQLDAAVIAVDPAWTSFYQGLFFFKKLQVKTVQNYSFVNGAPAAGFYHEIDEMLASMDTHFSHRRDVNNVRKFFASQFKCHHFPPSQIHRSFYNCLRSDLLKRFFSDLSPVFSQLTEQEKLYLWKAYPTETHRHALPKVNRFLEKRLQTSSARFSVVTKLWCAHAGQSPQEVKVLDVSKNGLKVSGDPAPDSRLFLHIEVGPSRFVSVEGKVVWTGKNEAGIQFVKENEDWFSYINDLQNLFEKAPALQRTPSRKVG